ncbi:MAG: phosphotransferase [Planctomycetota bacterium]
MSRMREQHAGEGDAGHISPAALRAAEADAGFAPGEIHRVRVQYAIGALLRAQPLMAGSPLAPKMLLRGSISGLVVLKRLAPGADDPGFVHVTHSIHRRLAAHGFPVAELLATKKGATALRLGGRTFEVLRFVAGKRCDRTPAQTREAGEALGRYHALLGNAHDHLQGIGRTIGEPRTGVYHDDIRVRQSLARLPSAIEGDDGKDLAARVGALYEAAAARARNTLAGSDAQIVHGDWHPGNLIYRGDRIAAVLDHESAGIAPSMLDVANGALQFSLTAEGPDPKRWPTAPDQGLLGAFLEGVRSGRAIVGSRGLSEEVWAALPWLMAEALIAEAAIPIAGTGTFHGREPATFLRMVARKSQWFTDHAGDVLALGTG